MKKIMTIFISAVLLLTGCASTVPVESTAQEVIKSNVPQESVMQKSEYQKITQEEAKKIMENNSGVTILDVRTKEEYDEGHIQGAILIPDYEIGEMAEEKLPDKSAEILVYCRTGRRSANAAQQLIDMGYTNVKDFGGIVDWNHEIVTD